jgi:hypothetical protein
MKKSISTEQTRSNIDRIIELLTGAPGKLEDLSKDLSDKQLHQPLAPGERTFVEVLAHMLNSEARSSEAIYLALLADEPLFTGVHPERQWGKLLRYDLLPFSDLLAYFKFRRTVFVKVLISLTDEQWSRSVREDDKKRSESVYWKARSLALHEWEHFSEIEGKV